MELLNTQLNAKETYKQNSGNEIINRIQVGETPFVMVNTESEKFLTIGQYRITKNLNTNEAKKIEGQIKKTDWQIMMAVIGAIVEQTVQIHKTNSSNT